MSTTIGTSNLNAAYKTQSPIGANAPTATQQRLGNLFQQIDMYSTGSISKSQFEQAFNRINLPAPVKELGADAVLSKIAPDNAEIITKKEFVSGLESIMIPKDLPPTKALTPPQDIEAKQSMDKKVPFENNVDNILPKESQPAVDGWSIGYIINTTA